MKNMVAKMKGLLFIRIFVNCNPQNTQNWFIKQSLNFVKVKLFMMIGSLWENINWILTNKQTIK